MDGIVRGRPVITNRILGLWKALRRKRFFLVDGIFRGRPEITNRILGLWKALRSKRCFRVDGIVKKNNTEYYPDPVQSTMEKKEMIPGGWISQREAANTQHHPGLVEDNMEEKEMIPGGWNRQREASNKQQDSGSAEGPSTKPSSHRYLQLFRLIVSWKGLGISLLAIIFGVIAL